MQHPHQRREVRTIGPSMHKVRKALAIAARIEGAHEGRRRRPHHREHALDRIEHALHASEGQRRRNKRDDLLIGFLFEPVRKPHRVAYRIAGVELCVERVELAAQLRARSW
jgi:hypothetical protein